MIMIKEFQREYRWLSNFTPVSIELNKLIYPSVEHAYMSAKSNDINWKKFCADSKNQPGTVKKKSRTVKLIDDWGNKKLGVMEECIRQKFNQERYKSKLIETGDTYIQKGNTWNDVFFGVCLKTNKGENHLGKLIMKVREELKNETY